jgi:hypothetical protein
MSGTIAVDGAEVGARATPEARVNRAEPAIAIDDPADAGQSDADAIRETREALERTTAQLTVAQNQRAAAQNDAAQARDQAARAAQGRAADQRMVLAQTVETADADLARARTMLRTAHETGDADAIGAATEAISSATYRKTHAASQLAILGDGTQQPPRQTQGASPPQSQDVPGARSRQWISEHPRFDQDPEYRALAILAHNQAVARGFRPETDERYYEHINHVVDAVYGSPTGGQPGGRDMSGNGGRSNGGGVSSAAPSNRGGGNHAGASRQIRTDLGVLEFRAGANGAMRVVRPTGQMAELMDEGASVCFPTEYAKDKGAAIDRYIADQAKIALEREAGGDAGMVPMGEGRTYR